MELRAGELRMMYENGFLREIFHGKEEVLHMIYFAVRDKDWETIPSRITDERIIQHADSFQITYRRTFDQGDIQMQWQVRIEGHPTADIYFEVHGQALSTFYKNRTGVCVLHPVKECMGKELTITHTDGAMEKGAFPIYISPHQPFKDITAMQWRTGTGHQGKLSFTGDVFEMEDQRNWTDNSFKTYCTPLEKPFPALMHQGEQVHQNVHFSLSPSPIPAIGIGRPAVRNKNYLSGLQRLSGIGFSHYRMELRLSDPSWSRTLADALEESELLQAPLEVALFISRVQDLDKVSGVRSGGIRNLILLEENRECISNQLVKAVLPLVRDKFPGVQIGAGTDSHFTELNRSDLLPDGLDFISYAIHPQVHAFDDVTLMENAAAQGYTVETASHRFGIPVHISPVTLHDRRIADPRLRTDFAVRWMEASIKSLRGAGAASITYFETLGDRGIAAFDNEYIPFPVLEAFKR